MIKYNKWFIIPDQDQWIVTDKMQENAKGELQVSGRPRYLSSIESLFRYLLEQSTRDKAEDCETLVQVLEIFKQTAQELKDMFQAISESVTARTEK